MKVSFSPYKEHSRGGNRFSLLGVIGDQDKENTPTKGFNSSSINIGEGRNLFASPVAKKDNFLGSNLHDSQSYGFSRNRSNRKLAHS